MIIQDTPYLIDRMGQYIKTVDTFSINDILCTFGIGHKRALNLVHAFINWGMIIDGDKGYYLVNPDRSFDPSCAHIKLNNSIVRMGAENARTTH